MQQRRVRLGDILDDYCPRERRITNHAVVAMIDDTVKQTRCTTCDADHEYKEARVPAPRRRKTPALDGGGADAALRPRPVAELDEPVTVLAVSDDEAPELPSIDDAPPMADAEAAAETHREAAAEDVEAQGEPEEPEASDRDEWPVHRPLIRATLPRPEGQTPERRAPDFTIHSNARPDARRNGQRNRGPRAARSGHDASGPMRFGSQRHGQGRPGGGGSRQGSGQGQGQGQSQGQRHGNRPGQGGGARPHQGRGRKRGR